MRNYLILLFASLMLTACGSGGSGGGSGGGNSSCTTCSTGSTIPVGSVSGTSFDGLIINGTVRVYDFTTGAKGAFLGSAQTDSNGLYSLSLQIETRPVLLEVTGGYYVEEAGTVPANISLSSTHKLTAVANYSTGSALTVAVTTYSHLSAGLAAYQIKSGTPVSTAIDNANTRVSSLVGVNILTTTPKEITDPGSASASLTPSLRYGFLAGAISDWTYANTPAAAVPHQPPYTSIDFAQLLYDDIAADGILDGVGAGGTSLSFGTAQLGVDVYRLGIGKSIVRIAGNPNNKTGLNGTKVLSFAQAYIANTDAIFSGVPVQSFASPTLAITSPGNNAWTRRVINVTASASSPFGLQSAEFLVDGSSSATTGSSASLSFSVDTSTLADGPHTLTVRSTDVGGITTTATIPMRVDNTPPTATMNPIVNCTGANAFYCLGSNMIVTGTASDSYSGVVGATVRGFYYNGVPNVMPMLFTVSSTIPTGLVGAGGVWTLSPVSNVYGGVAGGLAFRIYDVVGNCSDYVGPALMTDAIALTLVTSNACP